MWSMFVLNLDVLSLAFLKVLSHPGYFEVELVNLGGLDLFLRS